MRVHDIPLISVVMPCHNAQETVAESIECVLRQTYPNVELVVVDDGSTDASPSLLAGIAARDARVRVCTQPNRGAAAARNRALAESRGALLAFLDADDTWDTTCLEKLSAALTAAQADIAYCGWQNTGVAGRRGEPFIPPDYAAADRAELFLGGNRWPIHAVLVRAAIVHAAGGFDESLSSCMDYDLWLRIAPFHPVVRVAEVLAFYRHHEGTQITKNRARIALNHQRAQRRFLATHPEVVQRLGRARVRELTLGHLLERGFNAYWKRDLPTARAIFRAVMRAGYGDLRHWRHMLPSLLPLSIHETLLGRGGKGADPR